MAETNRRHFPRQNEDATIQVLIPSGHSEDPEDRHKLIPVKLYNQSEDGLYIEINRALKPGANVSFKMVAPEGDQPGDVYYMNDGRVIWCKKVDDETSRFGVGVQIIRKVVQAEIMTSRFGKPA